MGKFIFYVLKIVFSSFTFALLIQYLADSGLKKMDNSIYACWQKIFDGQINSDLIILGSSRGYVSYDPGIIQKTTGLSSYNLSFNAGSYNLQNLKFDLYLKNNISPKVVVQNIDIPHYGKSQYIPEEFQFLPFLENKELVRQLSAINPDYYWNHHIPLYKYNSFRSFLRRGIFSYLGMEYSILPNYNGYAAKNILFKKDEHNLIRLREMSSDSLYIESFKKKLTVTREFLNRYKSDSLKIFLVWAPEYKERLEIMDSILPPIKESIYAMVSNMPGVYFLDFSEDPISLQRDYFYDTFHLNEKGATLFSTRLSIEVDKILKK